MNRREAIKVSIHLYRKNINARVTELKDTLNQTKRDNLTEELRDWIREMNALIDELVPELQD